MRLALISDIHGNLPALEVVLDHIKSQNVDRILSLGDIVGYGPFPKECVQLLMEKNIKNIIGNHDAGVVGTQDLNLFREPNHSHLKWSREQLSDDEFKYLNDSPYSIEDKEHEFIAVHASPIEPHRWRYIQSAIDGRKILDVIPHKLCFVGHTHISAVIPERLGVFNVKPGVRFIINPGSVGQPREHDKRASYGIFDFEKFSYQNFKLEYNKTRVFQQFSEIDIDRSTAKRLMPI